ncbi:hypothetical protein DICVIV_09893 [Dictyocaulus viviparus]|uniref:Uncharacterized protein n=1 Tax=Dictyocaulus viviparus TaxID=29172 RepID=A0A0D8XHI9_DICVI|nr:hypothetical protein DICVIV_09893 [Dictyocaulus viviparus]
MSGTLKRHLKMDVTLVVQLLLWQALLRHMNQHQDCNVHFECRNSWYPLAVVNLVVGWDPLNFAVGWDALNFVVGWDALNFVVGWDALNFVVSWDALNFVVGWDPLNFVVVLRNSLVSKKNFIQQYSRLNEVGPRRNFSYCAVQLCERERREVTCRQGSRMRGKGHAKAGTRRYVASGAVDGALSAIEHFNALSKRGTKGFKKMEWKVSPFEEELVKASVVELNKNISKDVDFVEGIGVNMWFFLLP